VQQVAREVAGRQKPSALRPPLWASAGEVDAELTADLAKGARMLVTKGCGDECPVVPGARRDDWPLPDPKGRPLDQVRAIRDEIEGRVHSLVAAEGWSCAA
jgi:arsenate reductase